MGLSALLRTRHCQLPPRVLGVFIRASLPKPSMSCIGAMDSLATEAHAARCDERQWREQASKPRFDYQRRLGRMG